MRFLPVGAAGPGPAVVRLDDEGVLLLALAVHRADGPQHPLARRSVQHHGLEGSILPVDLEGTDLPWKKRERLTKV